MKNKNNDSSNSNTLIGYNPLRQNRPRAFNSNRTTWADTVSQVTDEQKKNAAEIKADMIKKTRGQL